jgi:hypothetical protein
MAMAINDFETPEGGARDRLSRALAVAGAIYGLMAAITGAVAVAGVFGLAGLTVDPASAAPAQLLGLRNHRQGERGFTRGFRPEHLANPAPGKSAHAQRTVNHDVAGGNRLHVHLLARPKAHDRPVPEVLGDLLDGKIEIFVPSRGDTALLLS